ncbi:unnamed protein product [Rotaria magnacalcarata]|uniref:Deacetylase sirtuin-type domain-containing protein n=1 Tax=Rotaria magnacalcarata TaxID=392030 RepID=A0A816VG66_9BILA|nr:unnamed protein product [Rotaria magnacalcarata]
MASTTTGKIAEFRRLLSRAHSVLVLTGAGISAESGVPTFRGAAGVWRQFRATVSHIALAEAEKRFEKEGKRFNVITQNVDGLHRRAGTQNLIEMHGNLFMVRRTSCEFIEENNGSPICEAFANRRSADENSPEIDEKDLPHCRKCKSLLRPHIVWFGEHIWNDVTEKVEKEIQLCDLFLVVGTSSVVYPAAGYASILAERNIPIAEINIETTPSTSIATYHFHGPAAQLIPQLLSVNIV